ncbi:peroxidase-related enzyme [Phyllobacterium sophorae]|uniref:Carboxymuconolactone decarboxylase-like domain-containing protein n=1 Tax=Phyllobacterium sophorae TaxID=1520277 RepID=A0A2P7B341_9HYPH|nr:peroxidase-related enzyme [Phyllobacterium sophorae]PSH60876.1 hypothetical protein CU103_25260 [Phyllobacterium sophorae]
MRSYSNSLESPPSWLELPLADSPRDDQQLVGQTSARAGRVSPLMQVLSFRPDLAEAMDFAGKATIRNQTSSLTPLEREFVAVVVTSECRATSSLVSHTGKLAALSGDPLFAARVEINFRRANLPSRLLEMGEFASKLIRSSHLVQLRDIQELRDAGLSDIEILDLVGVVAYFMFSVCLIAGLGIELDSHTLSDRTRVTA